MLFNIIVRKRSSIVMLVMTAATVLRGWGIVLDAEELGDGTATARSAAGGSTRIGERDVVQHSEHWLSHAT